jgi:hypothetical protein
MTIKTSQGNINVDPVGPDQDEWFTIKSQSVTFSKQDFFIDQFESSFPDSVLLGSTNESKFKFLNELCSRKRVLQNWYSSVSLKYSNSTQLPLYLKYRVDPSEFKRIQDKMLSMKDKLSNTIIERKKAADVFKQTIDLIEAKENKIIEDSTSGDNIMKIVNLSTESLPFSIQLLIQGYTPTNVDEDLADNKRRYAQEQLAKFKIALLKLNEENENIDIDKLIEEIELK